MMNNKGQCLHETLRATLSRRANGHIIKKEIKGNKLLTDLVSNNG